MTRTTFRRRTCLDRWPGHASWGYDAVLESYWALLRPGRGGDGEMEIGPDHLIGTLPGLARAVARMIGADESEVYVALTCPQGRVPREATPVDLT